MINFEDAFANVLKNTVTMGVEQIPLNQTLGRVLAEDIFADRDFPPFNRATKDGIVLNYEAIEAAQKSFTIEGICAAGAPQKELKNRFNCLEIMTGAVLPKNADTIIMYEQVSIEDGKATLLDIPKKGINIHKQGADAKKGSVLLSSGCVIDAAEVGILATVGKSVVAVKMMPKVAVISTGNELVAVTEVPLDHQIRKSNVISLEISLLKEGIKAGSIHLPDKKDAIKKALKKALHHNDVLILSGGVSKGKYDYIPEVMEALGVLKIFHRVAQKPGKPFWFGVQKELETVVFSFPGNPVSTFANYQVYFIPWLQKSLGLSIVEQQVVLEEEISVEQPLTRFIQVSTYWKKGVLVAKTIHGNGSGDLTTLSRVDGFIALSPKKKLYAMGDLVPFIKVK